MSGSGIGLEGAQHGSLIVADILKDEEPFHAIHVGAAAEEIPEALLQKMRPNSRMVIPVGPRYSSQVRYLSVICSSSISDLSTSVKSIVKIAACSCVHPVPFLECAANSGASLFDCAEQRRGCQVPVLA